MTRLRHGFSIAITAAQLVLLGPITVKAGSADTVFFSSSDPGVTKSVATWGVDTAWPNFDNVRESVANIGQSNVDEVRVTFDLAQPLAQNADGTFSLNATAKSEVDTQLLLAALAGSKPLTLVPGALPASFEQTNWVRTIKATQEYINSKPGFTTTQIKSIEAFNEPDYWGGEGTAAQLNSVITQLKAYPVFANTAFPAASTLNSDNAQSWYDQIPASTQGSSHLLGGSLTSWVNFIEHVKSTGKTFTNPELHSLGEAIVGADHGMTAGIFWADALRARGLFVQASDGKQLGYYEDLPRQSAAAVYRGPDGHIYAFAGGLERFGRATPYRFVSTGGNVYFNGIPVRQYMLQTNFDQNASATNNDFVNYGSWSSQGAFAEITTDGSGDPALDGSRWKIVNVSTGQVIQVQGSGTGDGAAINSAGDSGGLNQQWNIVRTRNGYYELFNANSGRTIGVNGGSIASGASLLQYGHADNSNQQWYLQSAGNGSFYLRNAWSNEYFTSSAINSYQSNFTGSGLQQWKFVLSDPDASTRLKAQYKFQGNVADSIGAHNGAAFGNPTYANGPTGQGQAINLNGTSNYVQLPGGVASSKDITISALVKWNGGNAWQRIFDFGNDTTSYMFLTPQSGDNTMRFAITTTGGDGEQVLDTDPLPVGQWVHLALTLGGNTGVLYVNGQPKVAGQILLNPSDINPTLNYIGKSQFAADPLFGGMIDDFRIYDYGLDQAQVASLVPYRWTGALNPIWTPIAQSNPKNWQFVASAADYADGDVVLFDDNAGNFNITVTSTGVTPSSVLFDNSIHNYTLSGLGPITGTAALTKNGTAALTINNGNTYSGGTALNGGTLNINSPSAIGSGPLTIAAGTTIDNTSGLAMTLSTNNPQVWNGDFTFGGSNPLNVGNGAVTLTGNRTVTVNGTGALTIAGPISQSGGSWQLTKAGPGTLTLAQAAGVTLPGLTASGGTLNLGGAAGMSGPLNITGALAINDDATVNLVPAGSSAARVTNNFVNQLSIGTSGLLDLGNHFLLVDNTATPESSVRQYLANGYHADPTTGIGDWNGRGGITSSDAIADHNGPSASFKISVGYVNGAYASDPLINGPIPGQETLPTNRILIRPALYGDLNLDGKVDDTDLAIFSGLGMYNQPTDRFGWLGGDLNHDGKVDDTDLQIFSGAGNYNGPTYGSGATPTLTSASASAAGATQGVIGDGVLDFVYDPSTGHVKVLYDGDSRITAANPLQVIRFKSAVGHFIPANFNASGFSNVTTDSSTLNGTILGGGSLPDAYDLGAVLPAGLQMSDLLSDLTLEWNVCGGGLSLKNGDVVLPEPGLFVLIVLTAFAPLSRRPRLRRLLF